LAGAERTQADDLGRLQRLRDPLGLLDQNPNRAVTTPLARAPGVNLKRDQDLVLLGHLRCGADELEI